MADTVKISYKGAEYEYPIVEGTMGDIAFDISKLRADTGLVTMDVGYKNTGATTSAITFLNGEKGQLVHRGYTIEDLANKASFTEVIYLLLYGQLPTQTQHDDFTAKIKAKSKVDAGLENIFKGFPKTAHPMGVVASLTNALGAFEQDKTATPDEMEETIITLLAQFPTLCAWAYRNSMDLPANFSDDSLDYIENFYQMMFKKEGEDLNVDSDVIAALHKLLILHADHEQNCSASTVRIVGSSRAGLFTSVAAGISALWGPLHGGANQAVIEMLEAIQADGGDTQKFLAKAKDKSDPFRLMGFGHRVYKNFDPRARIIKTSVDTVLEKLNITDDLVDIAKRLEKEALEDDYFASRKLYPNVDFYSGIIYKALNIPSEMFTVMFALGRLPGWIAQWKELREEGQPIGRPRQVYIGSTVKDFTAMKERV